MERQDELKLTRLQKIALECHSDLKQPFLRMEIEGPKINNIITNNYNNYNNYYNFPLTFAFFFV